MTIRAITVADSISPDGIRLTTMELRYPKFIHAELMTHRVFSRNASSSRAIPVARLIADIERDPAMPVHWGRNEKGMQANSELVGWRARAARWIWASARRSAIRRARWMDRIGAHKQIVNRLIESHGHINVVVTATRWENWFLLRDHPDAQPDIRALAIDMRLSIEASIPEYVGWGKWHLPYITPWEIEHTPDGRANTALVKASVARCARVSYKTHDGREPTYLEDLKLYHRLAEAVPLHASPTEHQATPDKKAEMDHWFIDHWEHPELWGNFNGWIQYRKTLPGESGESESNVPKEAVPRPVRAKRK